MCYHSDRKPSSRTVRCVYAILRGDKGSDKIMWEKLQDKIKVIHSIVGVAADQKMAAGDAADKGKGKDKRKELSLVGQVALDEKQFGSPAKSQRTQTSMTAFMARSATASEPSSIVAESRQIDGIKPLMSASAGTESCDPAWVYDLSQHAASQINPSYSIEHAIPCATLQIRLEPSTKEQSRGPLSPTTKARIEANKQAALKIRAAKKAQEQQLPIEHSNPPLAPNPLLPSGEAIDIYGTERVFLTGRGSRVQVSVEGMNAAERLLDTAVQRAGEPYRVASFMPAQLLPPTAKPAVQHTAADRPSKRSVD
jgi:hypothetical protein